MKTATRPVCPVLCMLCRTLIHPRPLPVQPAVRVDAWPPYQYLSDYGLEPVSGTGVVGISFADGYPLVAPRVCPGGCDLLDFLYAADSQLLLPMRVGVVPGFIGRRAIWPA